MPEISVIPLNHEIHVLAVAHNDAGTLRTVLYVRTASMISPENDKLE